MAGSDNSGSGETSQLPKESEGATITIKINTKLPRRQLTLIAITVLLNVLLWSSFICLVTTVYQIASRPDDTTNIPSEVLTLTSALATIAYIILHTIFSLKQRIWKHQGRHPSIVKKTSYIAIRVAVTLCILWLLTSGWNMITVARRPVCRPEGPGLSSWEVGATCRTGRAGIAFAMIALMASCALFWMLSVVRRPFEAHLLKHGYRPPSTKPDLTPGVSRRPSPSRSASFSEKYRRGRVSASTHRSTLSNTSNTDVDTIDLGGNSPSPIILAPSPMRSIGLSIFTSHAPPPPLPPAFALPPRTSSIEPPLAMFQPSASNQHLPPPPRMSALVAPSGFVPLSIPTQFSASAWRAVHPLAPSPLGQVGSRSHPHLPHTNSVQNFTYRSRYSRSSVSLTRPHRLSSTTPAGSVAWSSRSGSTGPDEGRGSPSSGEGTSERRATANEIAYAILNGTCIPGANTTTGHAIGHMRHVSAPDVTTGAQQSNRMSKGWKPQLKDQMDHGDSHLVKMPRSSSDLLSRFSPDTSPDDDRVNLRGEFEKDLELRVASEKSLPVRKIRSSDLLRYSSSPPNAATSVAKAPAATSPTAQTSEAEAGAQTPDRGRRTVLDEVKNKPLPKIAVL